MDVSLDSTALGRTVRLLVPENEDDVLDAFIAADRQDADPFFGSVWPCSRALAARLHARPALALSRRVLDCGCGLGLAGLAAALCGAKATVLADAEHYALACVARSVAANGFALAEREALADSLLAGWQPSPGAGRVFALPLDWRSPPAELLENVDLLLLADCLYEKEAAHQLAALATACVTCGGVLLLADPTHRTPAHRAAFLALLCDPAAGWQLLSDEELSVEEDGKLTAVRLLELHRGVR